MQAEALQQARTFLATLAAPYPNCPAARIELRALGQPHRNTYRRPRGWYPLSETQRAAQDALGWSRSGWDVYAGVLPRTQGGGGAAHLRLCSWLWCDIDGNGAGPREALLLLQSAFLAGRVFSPQIITCSGGGVHAYWRLAEPVACGEPEIQARIRQYLRRIVAAINGSDATPDGPRADLASTDPARILRVPGTINHKLPDNPRAVELLGHYPHAKTHSLDAWGAHLPINTIETLPPPRRTSVTSSSYRETGTLPPVILRRLSSGVPPGQRHFEMRRTAIWARKEGLDESVVRSYVEQVGNRSGVPVSEPAQQRHIDQMIGWVFSNVVPCPQETVHASA